VEAGLPAAMKRKTISSQLPASGFIELWTLPIPVDHEFKADRQVEQAFSACGLSFGRCFGSKSGYRMAHPDHLFVPNANVFAGRRGKVWWGDLDLACDGPKLQEVSQVLKVRLNVLRELDGRFEKAERPHSQVVRLAIWATKPLKQRKGATPSKTKGQP
jgi:hypothetical protein